MKHELALHQPIDIDGGEFERLESQNVLAPGFYWRAKQDITGQDDRHSSREVKIIYEGEILLLLDVHNFDGGAHSVELLCPPARSTGTCTILIQDLLEKMEPALDGEQVRKKEQADILSRVQKIQEDMATAEINPLQLPAVQEAVEGAMADFEREMEREVESSGKTQEAKAKDLRRVHRRAKRRSEAAGHPLAVQQTILSNQVAEMISGGVTSDGLRELTLEARRRAAIAKASSGWLQDQARRIGDTMKELAPYYAESGMVAIARARKAIRHADDVAKGLKSLVLYTGDGVDVVTVAEGEPAPTHEPLTLIQGKRYMNEEFAVHADVTSDFDYRNQQQFFDEFRANRALLEQVLPFPRCVVTMAVTRNDVDYGESTSAYEALMRNLSNQSVFLLVRNGGNVHAVYSAEPSHEAAPRLFPTAADVDKPFRGVDGSKIGLKDVKFAKAVARFEDMALHYRRFLILLCGLDHRMKLMGEFYPPEAALNFMSLDFQEQYFRFYQDEDTSRLIDDGTEPVDAWIKRLNSNLQSGSRVVLSPTAAKSSPGLERRRTACFADGALAKTYIVTKEGKNHYVSVSSIADKGWDRESRFDAKVWLDGPDAKGGIESFLCLDLARLETVHRYIHSRHNRVSNISWLRVFKHAEAMLKVDAEAQSELRTHLREAAMEYGGVDVTIVDEAMQQAISTWRNGHRGAPAPALGESKEVGELLTLMYPSGKLLRSLDTMIEAFVADSGCKPLQLVRTGRTRLALYVEAEDIDKEPYPSNLAWGWVKRISLNPLKSKVVAGTTSLVWLRRERANPSEEEMRAWPSLDRWLNEGEEVGSLRDLAAFKTAMEETAATWGPRLSAGRAGSLHDTISIEERGFAELVTGYRAAVGSSGKYLKPIWIHLPVGVLQRVAHAPVEYLYASALVDPVVRHYGSAGNLEVLAQVLRAHRYGNHAQRLAAPTPVWELRASKLPATSLVTVDSLRLTSAFDKRTIKVHAKDFFSKQWRYTETAVAQSWNRKVDTLVGRAPHLKREFYRDRAKQVADAKRWPHHECTLKEKLAFITSKRYAPSWSSELSPLLWDGERRVAVANKHFSLTQLKTQDE